MSGKILVAGGDPAFRIGLRARLAGACYQVTQAQYLEEALISVRALQPDIIIACESDNDPGAAQLCMSLRNDTHVRQAGIIALTSSSRSLMALQAGADDAQTHPLDELLLLARIRQLMGLTRTAVSASYEMAEIGAGFVHKPHIALIGPNAAIAIGWRHALAPFINARMDAMSATQALQKAAQGQGADLYIISADLDKNSDGLRLLSELRVRADTCDAAFVIALSPARAAMAPIALDLGAGDVLPLSLRDPHNAQEAALRLTRQLTWRQQHLTARNAVERNRRWAITDPLTELFNRRHALPRLEEMLKNTRNQAQSLAVMVLDLDRFKTVNDRYGHAAGDAALSQVAQRLTACIRPADLVARLGGEEFLIACPDMNAAQGCALAERLRHEISGTPIVLPSVAGGGKLHISASIGIAVTETADAPYHRMNETSQLLLAQADRALLTAKATGRNRVTLAPQDAAA